jgi:hypothetical protein
VLPELVTDVMRRKLLRRTRRQKGELSLSDVENVETRARSAYLELQEAWHFQHVIPNHDGEDSEHRDCTIRLAMPERRSKLSPRYSKVLRRCRTWKSGKKISCHSPRSGRGPQPIVLAGPIGRLSGQREHYRQTPRKPCAEPRIVDDERPIADRALVRDATSAGSIR